MLAVDGISLNFDGLKALSDVSFKVDAGEIFSIIGPNGAGKTSMLNCVSGRYRPSSGSISLNGDEITRVRTDQRAALGVGRTFQNLALFDHMTVLDNIRVGQHRLARTNFLLGGLYWIPIARSEEMRLREAAERIIDFLDIQEIRNEQAGSLSYGLRKRVELARAVALRPQLLLLDEPMAGMNLEEKEDMVRYIVDLNIEWDMTVIMIEHDMRVVFDISHRIMVLNFGRKIAEGLPSEVVDLPVVRDAYLGPTDEQ
jgi:branched-chain amino acid transport system ATP-binding protein